MKRLFALYLIIAASGVFAAETTIQCRVEGLFLPERKEALIEAAKTLPDLKLLEVDYTLATAKFAYDPTSAAFKNTKPEDALKKIDTALRGATKGCFSILPLSQVPPEKLREEKIAVGGLDCLGCSYGAYLAVAKIEGVERATASFKDGLVVAWIDPDKTNRAALEAALEKIGAVLIAPKN